MNFRGFFCFWTVSLIAVSCHAAENDEAKRPSPDSNSSSGQGKTPETLSPQPTTQVQIPVPTGSPTSEARPVATPEPTPVVTPEARPLATPEPRPLVTPEATAPVNLEARVAFSAREGSEAQAFWENATIISATTRWAERDLQGAYRITYRMSRTTTRHILEAPGIRCEALSEPPQNLSLVFKLSVSSYDGQEKLFAHLGEIDGTTEVLARTLKSCPWTEPLWREFSREYVSAYLDLTRAWDQHPYWLLPGEPGESLFFMRFESDALASAQAQVESLYKKARTQSALYATTLALRDVLTRQPPGFPLNAAR